jgi:hypothetical protein
MGCMGWAPLRIEENSLTVKYQLVELCDVGSSPISRAVTRFRIKISHKHKKVSQLVANIPALV